MKKIYIIHGWAYTTEKWDPFLSGLEAQGFETIFLKVPGLTAPLDRAWKLDDYVEWLSGVLASEQQPVTLLGHSNGGRISIAFAAKYPEKVRNLILIGAAGVYHRDFKIRMKRAIFGGMAKFGSALKENQMMRKIIYKLAREKDYRDASPMMRETMHNLISVDLVPLMPKIACPVLLIWGRHDGSTPYADALVMQKSFPNAELDVVSEARHSPHFTHAVEVLEDIRAYYEKKNF